MTFHRRLMILNLLRKIRLVRYVRPLKHFVLALIASTKEVLHLVVLILFIVALFAPVVFIIESCHVYECLSTNPSPTTRCIRTITDACYYLILIVSTVGYVRERIRGRREERMRDLRPGTAMFILRLDSLVSLRCSRRHCRS